MQIDSKTGLALLREAGYSAESWAVAHGFKPKTVRQVYHRHAFRGDTEIRGVKSQQILLALSETVGHAVHPVVDRIK
jgi:hypothetical protein